MAATDVAAPPGLAGRAVAAYGGAERWRAAEKIEARFDCGGLLFNWKRGPDNWRSLHIVCAAHRPQVRIEPFDRFNNAAVLDGGDVRIERPGGDPVEIRYDARSRFPAGRRILRWDQLDFAYFLSYALWNYLTLPAQLMNPDIAWREVNDATLEAIFPKHLPTHTKVQQYHFNATTGLLEQFDYTADVFGPWAKAAHTVIAHDHDDGLTYTSKRRVLPRAPSGKAMPGPLLIWADIHSFRLTC